MENLTTQIGIILHGLRTALGAHAWRDAANRAVVTIAWARVGRILQRFEALLARWQQGTLPKPRARRIFDPAASGSTPRVTQPRPYQPRRPGWLVGIVGYHAAGRLSQLQHLIAQPEMAAFLAAAPQAGRLLRPLLRMLSPDPLPALLQRPEAAAAAVPSRPRPAPPPNSGSHHHAPPESPGHAAPPPPWRIFAT